MWVRRMSDASDLARPKSLTFGSPSAVSRTLAGLRSRWTIPKRWASPTARASTATIRAAGPGAQGVPVSRPARLPPSMYSISK